MSFLNMTVLARQAKEAFKANKLKVGVLDNAYDEPGLTIFTLHNVYWVDQFNVPNKLKSIVAELLGFIPNELGDLWEGNPKEEPKIVDSALTQTLHKVLLDFKDAKIGYIETGVSIYEKSQEIKLIQNKADSHIKGIKQEYLNVIDITKLDYDVENTPVGPVLGSNTFIYFSNATTLWATTPYPIGSCDYASTIVDTLTLLDLDPRP